MSHIQHKRGECHAGGRAQAGEEGEKSVVCVGGGVRVRSGKSRQKGDQVSIDLSDARAKELLGIPKVPVALDRAWQWPAAGKKLVLDLIEKGGRETFKLDINRSGRIVVAKINYHTRYARSVGLARLDVAGPAHKNPGPGGARIPCPHLHYYKQGYGLRYATPCPDGWANLDQVLEALRHFGNHCNIELPSFQGGLF